MMSKVGVIKLVVQLLQKFQPGKHLIIDGKECLNLATHNYLGFAGNEVVEEAAIECVKKFGVGSCGPRGFYGTAGNDRINYAREFYILFEK